MSQFELAAEARTITPARLCKMYRKLLNPALCAVSNVCLGHQLSAMVANLDVTLRHTFKPIRTHLQRLMQNIKTFVTDFIFLLFSVQHQ